MDAPTTRPPAGLRVEALAAEAQISVDTVRYYQKLGLLPGPTRIGRIGFYDESHQHRLARITDLAAQGFTLAQITDLLSGDTDPLLAELARRTNPAPGIDRAELARQSGLDRSLVDLAVDAGFVSAGSSDDETFGAEAVSMLRTAATLVAAGLPLDELAALVTRHATHVEALVDDAIEVFRTSSTATRSEQSETVQELIPLVSSLVGTHFERTLVERAIERLQPDVPT